LQEDRVLQKYNYQILCKFDVVFRINFNYI